MIIATVERENRWIPYDFEHPLENSFYNANLLLDKYAQAFTLPDWVQELDATKDTLLNGEFFTRIIKAGFVDIFPYEGKLYSLCGGGINEYKNPYLFPQNVIITNEALPNIKGKQLEIGKDVARIYLTKNRQGMNDLIMKTAQLRTEADTSLYFDLILNRANLALLAKDDDAYLAVLQFLEDLKAGKFGAIFNDSPFSEAISALPNQPSSNSMNLLSMAQFIEGNTDNLMGLNKNWNKKSEYIGDTEGQMNYDGLFPLVDNMLDTMNYWLKKASEIPAIAELLEGRTLTVALASSWDRERDREELKNDELEAEVETAEAEAEAVEAQNEEPEMAEISEEPESEPEEEPEDEGEEETEEGEDEEETEENTPAEVETEETEEVEETTEEAETEEVETTEEETETTEEPEETAEEEEPETIEEVLEEVKEAVEEIQETVEEMKEELNEETEEEADDDTKESND